MQPGSIVYLDYGEAPQLHHTRLIMGHLEGSEYMILTPDMDCYPEVLDVATNPDIVGCIEGADDGSIPAAIAGQQIYGFAPMTPAQLQAHLSRGRVEVAAERARRGLPPLAAPAAAGQGVAAAEIWVLAEFVDGKKIGDVVQPPANFLQDGSWGLVPVTDGEGKTRPTLIKRVASEDLGTFCDERIRLARASESSSGEDRLASEDVRTLEVRYGQGGERQRGFKETIQEMQEVEFDDWPLQPRATLSYLKAVAGVAESCFSQHLAWVSQSRIPEGDRAIHENGVLSRILDTALVYDALNVSNLACMELVVRRKQLIAEAHSYNPMAPSYEGADHYMGTAYRPGGAIVTPELTEYVARKMQQESSILKERRKLSEAKGSKGKGKGSPKDQPPKATPKGGQGGAT